MCCDTVFYIVIKVMVFDFLPTDVNECSDPLMNNCHLHADCTDVVGSFDCFCQHGYEGNGVTSCNRLINLQINQTVLFYNTSLPIIKTNRSISYNS